FVMASEIELREAGLREQHFVRVGDPDGPASYLELLGHPESVPHRVSGRSLRLASRAAHVRPPPCRHEIDFARLQPRTGRGPRTRAPFGRGPTARAAARATQRGPPSSGRLRGARGPAPAGGSASSRRGLTAIAPTA